MTTPSDFNTPSMAIKMALVDAGKLDINSDPSSSQLADGMSRLFGMIGTWQTKGLKLWSQLDLPVPITANKAKYAIGPGGDLVMTRPLRVNIGAYYLDSSSNKRPLVPLSYDEYIRLSNTVQPGQINSYFVDKQQTTLNVFFWLTPDATAATGTPHIIVQQQLAQPAQLNDTLNFPVEWFQALHWGLSTEYTTGQPQSIIDRCEQKALEYRTALEDWDVEDAPTKFEPDQRSMIYQGQFR